MKYLILISLCILSDFCFSQDVKMQSGNKGEMYVYWGWNREWFTDSDIHFKGETFDFVLYNVQAKDNPEEFSFETYFSPKLVTIPQYNFRVGYFFRENWHGSIGVDHMKYVVVQNQQVTMNGIIDGTASSYNGVYENSSINLDLLFLQYEHTDGLNYGNLEIGRFDNLTKIKNMTLGISESVGMGLLFPKTDARLLSYERHNKYHVSGYGINATIGLNLTVYKGFFIQSEFRGGYINMPDVKVTYKPQDKASQSFFYSQANILFGVKFPLQKQSNSNLLDY